MAEFEGYRLWPAYQRLWTGWVQRYWKALAIGGVMIAINAVANGAMVRLTVWLVDAFEHGKADAIFLAPFVVLGIALIRAATLYGYVYQANTALSTVEADMQRDMHRALIDADLAHLQSEPPAALAARFNADITLIRSVLLGVFAGAAYVATIIAAFTQMLLIDWAMTLGLMGIFGVAMIPISAIGQRLKGLSMRTQQEISTMTAQINEGLDGSRLAKTYRLEDYLQASADTRFEHLRRLKIKAADWRARVEPLMEALGGIAMAALIAFVGYRIVNGSSSVAEFSGFLAGLAIAMQPMRKLGAIYAQLSIGFAALVRVYDLVDRRNTVVDAPNAYVLPKVKGDVSFEEVGFRYPDGTRALSSISLDVTAGTTVALVGRSGAGKTSVFNLIPRLYDVTEGTVRIDGHDLRDVQVASLRDQIALVSQESVLLTDTVAANIGFGREGASRAEIEAAAKDAAAHDFIKALPHGYDTRIDEDGGSFSGGQRQRLSIARAMLRDAPILLLDEPTSALDAESESSIRKALARLGKGRTRFIIAHRLATILDSDLIVAMDAGTIVETGTHEALLAEGGLYADLYRLQFRA